MSQAVVLLALSAGTYQPSTSVITPLHTIPPTVFVGFLGRTTKGKVEFLCAYCLLAPWWSLASAFLNLLREVVL